MNRRHIRETQSSAFRFKSQEWSSQGEPQAHAYSGLARARVRLVTFIQTPVPSCTDTFISFQLL